MDSTHVYVLGDNIYTRQFFIEVTLDRNSTQSLPNSIIRVLVADLHQVVRNGICHEIAKHNDLEVVGETANGREVLCLARQFQPDVVIMDARLEGLSGVQVTRHLSRITWETAADTFRSPLVLIFSTHSDKQYVWSLLSAGARGYLLKSEPLEQLILGIRQVAAGQTILSLPIQTSLVELVPRLNQELSESELKVLELMARGLSNSEIARHLQITEGTVKTHLHNTYRKVPWIHSRAEAVAWAWINHLVTH